MNVTLKPKSFRSIATLLLIFGLQTLIPSAYAQDTLTYYFNKNNKKVKNLNEADFIRTINPSAEHAGLFEVKEVYKNKSLKHTATVSRYDPSLQYEGIAKTYNENGVLVEELNYKKNKLSGVARYYYRNGQLKQEVEYKETNSVTYPPALKVKMISYLDSLGTQQVRDGSGIAEMRTADFTEKGRYVNGFKDSVWTGNSSKDDFSYVETYRNGKLIAGLSTKDGKEYKYTEVDSYPTFPGGMENFYRFVAKNFNYPAEARRNGISGRLILGFTVEKDGELSDIKLVRDIGMDTGLEAIRVLKKSKKWIPGKQRGIPVKVAYTLPIMLNLSP